MSAPIIIKNDCLELAFTPVASEWTSLRDQRSGLEYAWNGDPEWWSGRNPTLFPFVGKLNGEQYRHRGQTYHLGNHGFARHATFRLDAHEHDHVRFVLEDDAHTRVQYPFAFRLETDYRLRANRLDVTISATNTGIEVMPLTLGAHPAFNCPLRAGERLDEYRLVFAEEEHWWRRRMNPDSSWQRELIDAGAGREITLSHELFADDVVAFWQLRSPWVELRGPLADERVRLYRGNSEQFGLWQKPGAPFVCLEPWRGWGDPAGWSGEILDRPDTTHLASGECFTLTYGLEIGVAGETH